MIPQIQRALDLAKEHVAWAKMEGLSPADVLRGLDYRVPRSSDIDWAAVIDALADAWLRLDETTPQPAAFVAIPEVRRTKVVSMSTFVRAPRSAEPRPVSAVL